MTDRQRILKLERQLKLLTSKSLIKDTKYSVVFKGEVLLTYDENPQNKIEDLTNKLEATRKVLAKVNQELGDAKALLAIEEGDHAALRSDFRRQSEQVSNLEVDNREMDRELTKLEERLDEANTSNAKLKSASPIDGFGGIELIKMGIKKLFRR